MDIHRRKKYMDIHRKKYMDIHYLRRNIWTSIICIWRISIKIELTPPSGDHH